MNVAAYFPWAHRRSSGFTFVELLVTLAIMATLALVALPMAEMAVKRNKERQLRSALGELRGAIDAYKRAADQGRIRLNVGDSGYPKSLDVLVEGVDDQTTNPRRTLYFLRRIPVDPMSDEPGQSAAGSWAYRSYESPPDDPREGEDIFDVFSKSTAVGINGVPYREW